MLYSFSKDKKDKSNCCTGNDQAEGCYSLTKMSIQIEGKAINCTGCYFKSYLLNTEPFCKRTGQEIKEIRNCSSGPLVQRRPFLAYLKHLLFTGAEDSKAFWRGIGL